MKIYKQHKRKANRINLCLDEMSVKLRRSIYVILPRENEFYYLTGSVFQTLIQKILHFNVIEKSLLLLLTYIKYFYNYE